MPSDDQWKDVGVEVERLIDDPKYDPVRPLLDSVQALVGAKTGSPATARALLKIADTLRTRQAEDGDVKELAEELARGKFAAIGAVEGDMLQASRDIIVNIIGDFKDKIKDSSIRVDIVPLAMVAQEAAALADKTAFAGNPDALRENFESLSGLMDKGFENWRTHYGPKRQDWRPFENGGDKTIADYVKDALGILNKRQRDSSASAPQFRARFHDICALDKHGDESARALLVDLRAKGSVMIIDTVSMRHPRLIRASHRAMLDVFPRTSIVSLAPGGQILGMTKQMIQVLESSAQESELYRRIADPFEPEGFCAEFDAIDRAFPKWFISRVNDIYGRGSVSAGEDSPRHYY